MAFKDTYRLEKVYYENIWTLLNMLKNIDKNNVDMGTVKELLDNAIADNESIIIIYKNLGELYAELQNQHMELGKELEKLKDSLEEFKDEINDKIDENHNYLMGLIKDLEQRVDALEQAVDSLEERMDQAETDIDNLETRMDTAEGDIDNLETAVDGLEDNLTALEGRVTTNEGDIDDLEQNKQDKLTAGSGIAIDPDTNEISNTAQGKIYTAGSGIAIDPVTNEITNTAQGKIYTAGSGIAIDPDTNEISATGGIYFPGKNIVKQYQGRTLQGVTVTISAHGGIVGISNLTYLFSVSGTIFSSSVLIAGKTVQVSIGGSPSGFTKTGVPNSIGIITMNGTILTPISPQKHSYNLGVMRVGYQSRSTGNVQITNCSGSWEGVGGTFDIGNLYGLNMDFNFTMKGTISKDDYATGASFTAEEAIAIIEGYFANNLKGTVVFMD